MFIIRRSVFEEIGGFRELRDAGHEDWEFYVRLALAGFRIDILPELLQYYRQVEDGLARDASVRTRQAPIARCVRRFPEGDRVCRVVRWR